MTQETPQVLITIAHAARLAGKHPNTLTSWLNMGQLTAYPNPKARNPRREVRLVDLEEIIARWPQAREAWEAEQREQAAGATERGGGRIE